MRRAMLDDMSEEDMMAQQVRNSAHLQAAVVGPCAEPPSRQHRVINMQRRFLSFAT